MFTFQRLSPQVKVWTAWTPSASWKAHSLGTQATGQMLDLFFLFKRGNPQIQQQNKFARSWDADKAAKRRETERQRETETYRQRHRERRQCKMSTRALAYTHARTHARTHAHTHTEFMYLMSLCTTCIFACELPMAIQVFVVVFVWRVSSASYCLACWFW